MIHFLFIVTSDIRLKILMYLYELHFSDREDASTTTEEIIQNTNLTISKAAIERELFNLLDAALIRGIPTTGGMAVFGITLDGGRIVENVIRNSLEEADNDENIIMLKHETDNLKRIKKVSEMLKTSAPFLQIAVKVFEVVMSNFR